MARKFMDIRCAQCGVVEEDRYVDLDRLDAHSCGGKFERVILNRHSSVITDDIPGGVEIKNGLCWPDGTPRRYDTKSSMKREAERRGWTNYVQHVPSKGSDKNPHTQRFV